MFSQLFVAVYLALFAAATPLTVRNSPVTVSLARRFNQTGSKTVLELDQARARFFQRTTARKGAKASTFAAAADSDPVTNGAVSYTAEVNVGSPPTTFSLIVDTGSSNTWVGADRAYTETSTSRDTGAEVEVEYGSGFFFGEEFIDEVSVGGLTIPQQSIGVAEFFEGFSGVDGILGIGPTDLTEGTTSSGETVTVPTFLDNAFSQGLLSSKEIGISFEPTTSDSITNGELTFGGTDSSKFTGELHFVPITSTSPANEFVGIDQSVAYGSTTILSETAGIVDTGTTLTLLASNALATYEELTGAVLDDVDTGLLTITAAQFANLQSLFFTIGSTTFEFTPNAQLWPRALNTAIGGNADSIYLVVGDLGSDSGEGLDFINGQTWLERFYFVFDAATPQAGFATTQFTDATTN
ncbi:uncharacterized protein PHACADRAFT_248741 [Phanerochaete carnosa HHB-10118-sp]|uniref:Peptidase A1 domain-containing protein n=1 Tax=Phanerochaete carnosa (strain HHB-10118-sp) TaxID=650164 RepID=K5WRJ2_PHACS|nr:uncharacterized protein PHACADRAFT_248741 [Phanerochaete carnosa HHB-10118-sp]EKM61854.1 hypothetical protein PHACADRAFT_248741 [Phanerochaete carnosa HHB-10118-sp]